jgi:hypothetical protein
MRTAVWVINDLELQSTQSTVVVEEQNKLACQTSMPPT